MGVDCTNVSEEGRDDQLWKSSIGVMLVTNS